MTRDSNERIGVYEDPVLSLRRFDELPPELRRVYALAPLRVHMGVARRRLAVYEKIGADVANQRKAEIFYLSGILQKRALETYGPEHPDAQRSRLEGKAAATMKPIAAASGGRA